MIQEFNGFTKATIDFMWELRLNNNRPWFEANKDTFIRELQTPMKALGLKRVAGGHAKENPASGKVLEKLGFIYARDDFTPHVDGVRVFESREYYLDLEDFAQ